MYRDRIRRRGRRPLRRRARISRSSASHIATRMYNLLDDIPSDDPDYALVSDYSKRAELIDNFAYKVDVMVYGDEFDDRESRVDRLNNSAWYDDVMADFPKVKDAVEEWMDFIEEGGANELEWNLHRALEGWWRQTQNEVNQLKEMYEGYWDEA